ncbi:MAG: hypothetical protein Q8R38_01640 [Candidatus Omnitrophota bacterium]|nr:hypothetical protein [Candidatus Omnitrophota bacterium]
MEHKGFLKSIILIAHIIAMLACAGVSAAQTQPIFDTTDWNIEESDFFIIYYRPTADLKMLLRRLNIKALPSAQTSVYSEINPPKEICKRLDSLFNEVRSVLGMYPVVEKVKIKIFKDMGELSEVYLILIDRKENFKAFYVNKYNTIYTSEDSMTDSVMVHEMAHVVIDHYFSAIPPDIVSEMIASYVDAHFTK